MLIGLVVKKIEEQKFESITELINNSRYDFNKNLERCYGIFSDEDYKQFEVFSNQFLISDIKTRNNLAKNVLTGIFNNNKFLYEMKDDNLEDNKDLYIKLMQIINKTNKNL